MNENYFVRLAAINVNGHIEKKGNFSYLSWPFAVSQLRQFDPAATWEVKRFDGKPYLETELGFFVEVEVTVQGIRLSQIHPVLDGKNRPILAPTAFDINTSIQRCLVKAIAQHGLGLYIYAGEDLPEGGEETGEKEAGPTARTPNIPASVTPLIQRGDTITPNQVRYIERLIAETGTELAKLLDYFGFSCLNDIPKADASRVIRSLEQSRTRKEAA